MGVFSRRKNVINIFLVHPRGMKAETLRQYAIRVSSIMNTVLMAKKDRRVCVTTPASMDFRACGGTNIWERWYSSVIQRYQVFVLVSPTLGRASSDIVRLALAENKPVRLLTSSGLIKVTGLNEINKEDWTTGWQATI